MPHNAHQKIWLRGKPGYALIGKRSPIGFSPVCPSSRQNWRIIRSYAFDHQVASLAKWQPRSTMLWI